MGKSDTQNLNPPVGRVFMLEDIFYEANAFAVGFMIGVDTDCQLLFKLVVYFQPFHELQGKAEISPVQALQVITKPGGRCNDKAVILEFDMIEQAGAEPGGKIECGFRVEEGLEIL